MSKYIDFTNFDLSNYLGLMKRLFEMGRYDDAKEVARSFMYFCAEQEGKVDDGRKVRSERQ